MNKNTHLFLLTALFIGFVLLFQNCGDGFSSLPNPEGLQTTYSSQSDRIKTSYTTPTEASNRALSSEPPEAPEEPTPSPFPSPMPTPGPTPSPVLTPTPGPEPTPTPTPSPVPTPTTEPPVVVRKTFFSVRSGGQPLTSDSQKSLHKHISNIFANQYIYGDFIVDANPWGAHTTSANWFQTLRVDGLPGWDYNWGQKYELALKPNSQSRWEHWRVKAYPQIILGVKGAQNGSGFQTYSHGQSLSELKEKTGFPMKYSEMDSINVSLKYNAQVENGYNATIESTIHSDCNSAKVTGDQSNLSLKVVLWLDKKDYGPEGIRGYVGDVTLSGIPLEIWTQELDKSHLSLVVKESLRPLTNANISWSEVLTFAKDWAHRLETYPGRVRTSHGGYNRNRVQENYCIANIMVGTELWWGRGHFQVENLEISTSDE